MSSGITPIGNNLEPLNKSGLKSSTPNASNEDFVNQGVRQVKTDKGKSASFQGSKTTPQEGVDVKNAVESTQKKPLKKILLDPERDLAMRHVFAKLYPIYQDDPNFMIPELKIGFTSYDSLHHAFQYRDHIVFATRESVGCAIRVGLVTPFGSKIGRGNESKIYPVQFQDDPADESMVLKLSKKKGGKERAQAGTRNEMLHEIRVIQDIKKVVTDSTGIGLDLYTTVKFNGQVGYFMKRYGGDGEDLCASNPTPYECVMYTEQIAKGMRTLHQAGYCIRDLKLDNTLVIESDEETIFLDGTKVPAYECVLSDFGSVCQLPALFEKKPYPSLQAVFGSHTPAYVSQHYLDEVRQALSELKLYDKESVEYKNHVLFIEKIIKENDVFASSLCFYRLWVGKFPNFNSFKENRYFCFDPLLGEKERRDLIMQMWSDMYRVSREVSEDLFGNEHHLANYVISPMQLALEDKLRKP